MVCSVSEFLNTIMSLYHPILTSKKDKTRMLIIFELKRYEMTGGWRKLHNEELRDLYHHQV
jgi:hypothetical protein